MKPDCTVSVSLENGFTGNNACFEGWGTSLCWWANRLGYSDRLAQKAAELFFGDGGLRLNIMRYNIGGGDDPSHHHITRPDSAVPGWMRLDEKTGKAVYDDEADRNQVNVLRRAVRAAGAEAYVEVFSNSPPYFMTVSGCSSGAGDANANNLREDCYEAFAGYLAHVAAYLERNLGIRVSSVSPMNEPNTDFWWAWNWKQEGCHVDPGVCQSRLLAETADAFRKQGLTETVIAASDETSPEKQVIACRAYTEEARAVIGRISTHTYDTAGIQELGRMAREQNFRLWMSEVDGGGTAGCDAKEMGAALWLARKVISDLNRLGCSAWVIWQVIDTHISAAGYNGNPDRGMVDVTGGFWGLAVADHDKEEIILTQKYYGFGQFTRYIRPGARLIPCGEDGLAAYDAGNGKLTVVLVNDSAEERVCRVELSGWKRLGKLAQVVRTSGGCADGESWARLSDIPVGPEAFTAVLRANSITTYVMDAKTEAEG